jgi:hypothetical protein
VFNSYPRSGSTYLRHIFIQVFGIISESIHIPEVLSVDYLNQISIFRKPEDSIASFITTKYPLSNNLDFSITSIDLSYYLKLYEKYMFYAEKNKDSIFIAKFDNIINNELEYFKNISEKFSIPFVEEYEIKFKSMNFSSKPWIDLYSGAYPREKDKIRLKIEDELKNIKLIQDLNKEYEDFIKNNNTIIQSKEI